MKPLVSHTWAKLLALGLLLVLVALVLPSTAWAHGPSDGGAKTSDINGLFKVIFYMSVPVFGLVMILIAYSIISSLRRRGDEEPEQVEGNHALEIGWTVASFAIVAVVFALSYRFMTTKYDAEAGVKNVTPDLTVYVTGYMFNWDYAYFENDGTGPNDNTGVLTTRTLTIPVNSNVLLEITSRDVQHSFWVSELAGKVDAIPGYTNTMWLNVDKPGLYHGNCAEFCGKNHWSMLIDVEVLPQDEFAIWLDQAKTEAAEMEAMGEDMESDLPPGDALRGADVFNSMGCNGCHQPEGGSFPSLKTIHEDMEDREGYDSADDYLRESILMPCAYTTEGYDCSIMPANYGERLDMQMLADLLEYLKSYEDTE